MRTLIVFFVLTIAASVCGAQWVHTSLPDSLTVMGFAVLGTNFFASSDNGVFLTTNNGTSWIAANTPFFSFNNMVQIDTNLFAGTYGGVFLSTNNGTSWTAVNSGLTNTSVLALAVSGTNLFAGTYGGVFLSTNNGTSWTAVDSGLTINILYALAVSGSNLFGGGPGGVFLSTNNGTSWTRVDTSLAPGGWMVLLTVSGTNLVSMWDCYNCCPKFSDNSTSRVSASSALRHKSVGPLRMLWRGLAGIRLSSDNGISWRYTGFACDGLGSLAVSETNIFAGTSSNGVFLSTNNGTSWTAVNAGLTDTLVYSLAVSGTNLFAGTRGSGVWRRPLSEMITNVEPVTIDLPDEYQLSQNYPNPFNPSTTIRYALPHTSFVSLTVYNILGQQIAQLVNEQQQAGFHDVVFRGDGLASGVYFYRLQGDSFGDVKKLILLK